jgi:uracil-DNA glycosylase family protein
MPRSMEPSCDAAHAGPSEPGRRRDADRSTGSLAALAAEAAHCTRCPLYRDATQVVFGEGPADARAVLVGEQPGDQEDIAGRPFVGPAGRLLDRALAEAGLDRGRLYLTNAVKHFKHELRGKRRLHKRPNADEIDRCRWWLDREIALIEPTVVVALGVTAASALFRRPVTLTRERGRITELANGTPAIVTAHPSAVLRVPGEAARHAAYAALVSDLRQVADVIGGARRQAS